MVLKNVNKYEGDWVADKAEGKGIMWFEDSTKFEGDWFRGVPQGDGIFTDVDQSIFKSYWSRGRAVMSCVQFGVRNPINSKLTIRTQPTAPYPFSKRPYLCYMEEQAYKDEAIPNE